MRIPARRPAPLRTIQRAAELAQPGDTITVHAGVYRERINPPRGGESDAKRIVYQAAPGEQVEIKGSEVVKGWVEQQDDVWKVTLPNSFFGKFNPFADPIRGDWFDPRGRTHHTGAVYLNGDWLTEAATLDEVLLPGGAKPAWLTGGRRRVPAERGLAAARCRRGPGPRIEAAKHAAQQGIQNAACSEGGECIGFIEHGEWVRYDGVDFGTGTERIVFRVASASQRRPHRDPARYAGRATARHVRGPVHWRLAAMGLRSRPDQAGRAASRISASSSRRGPMR